MTLTPEEKAERKRQRMIAKAGEYSTGTYIAKFVAKIFQRMVRAEAAAEPDGSTPAIINGEVVQVRRRVGQCVCITCGKIEPWFGGYGGGMNTGHFIASRRNSVLFRADNVACQCTRCNTYLGGAPQEYTRWMLEVRGQEAVDVLKLLKNMVVQFTREELVDKRIGYQARLDTAIKKMKDKEH